MFTSVRLDDSVIVQITAVDSSVAPELYRNLLAWVEDGVRRVVVDLGAPAAADDGVVAVLAAITDRVLRLRGQMYVGLGPDRTIQVHDVSLLRAALG